MREAIWSYEWLSRQYSRHYLGSWKIAGSVPSQTRTQDKGSVVQDIKAKRISPEEDFDRGMTQILDDILGSRESYGSR